MLRYRCLPVLVMSVLAGCGGTHKGEVAKGPLPQTEPRLEQKLPLDPQVIAGRLDNGLRYLIRRNQKPQNRAELRLVVDAGSVLEEDEEQGLAHFAEHMAFNGTAHFAKQELVDYLESIGMRFGADLNAYTSFDETVYRLTVPTDSSGVLETAFQILEDWAHQVSYEDEEIDKERSVVVEEWRLGRGAGRRMLDKQLPIILKDSRYARRLAIGQKAVLDTFHHQTLRNFYHTWYRPGLMGVVAVGDFEPAAIESLLQAHFARIAPAEHPKERRVYPVPDHEETLFAIATDPEATGNSVSIYYKQPVRDQSTVGAYRRALIEALYHSLFNQRLLELTRRPDPPFLYAGSSQGRWLRSREFFVLGAGVENNGFDRGLEALLSEAERVRRFGFTRSELEREKKDMLRGMEQAYRERDKSQSGGFAGEYVRYLLLGEPIPGIEKELELYRDFLPGIGLEELNALAGEWTSTKNRVIAVNAPQKEGIEVPDEEALLAVFARVGHKEITPYKDVVPEAPLVERVPRAAAIAAVDSIPEIGVTQWTLANGVRVFLKPTDFQNDEILFSAYSPGGHSLAADEDYVAAMTASAVVEESGVAGFDLIALQKKLAGKVVRVSPWIGDLQEGISGSASPEDLQTMFELIYAYFTAPRADSSAFLAYRERLRGSIENRSARPETAFGDTIQVTMAQHHYRARPWSLDLLEEMDLKKSMAVYRDRFAEAGDFSFFFVGNFTLDQIEPLVRTYVGGLPAAGRREQWKDVGIEAPEGVVEKVVYRGVEPKSQSRLIFSGPFEYDGWKNNLELSALATVLEIKLREVLREDLGGTYGVWVSASPAHYPEEKYTLELGFGCDPERVEELTRVVFGQIDSLKNYGTTQVYLNKVKEMRKRERERALKENSFWLNILEWADFHHVDPRLTLHYAELVDSLSTEALQKAARKYFHMDHYVRVVLLPEKVKNASN